MISRTQLDKEINIYLFLTTCFTFFLFFSIISHILGLIFSSKFLSDFFQIHILYFIPILLILILFYCILLRQLDRKKFNKSIFSFIDVLFLFFIAKTSSIIITSRYNFDILGQIKDLDMWVLFVYLFLFYAVIKNLSRKLDFFSTLFEEWKNKDDVTFIKWSREYFKNVSIDETFKNFNKMINKMIVFTTILLIVLFMFNRDYFDIFFYSIIFLLFAIIFLLNGLFSRIKIVFYKILHDIDYTEDYLKKFRKAIIIFIPIILTVSILLPSSFSIFNTYTVIETVIEEANKSSEKREIIDYSIFKPITQNQEENIFTEQDQKRIIIFIFYFFLSLVLIYLVLAIIGLFLFIFVKEIRLKNKFLIGCYKCFYAIILIGRFIKEGFIILFENLGIIKKAKVGEEKEKSTISSETGSLSYIGNKELFLIENQSLKNIKEIFLKLVEYTQIGGKSLKLGETPREFANNCFEFFPDLEDKISFITELFVESRYGHIDLPQESIKKASNTLDNIELYFKLQAFK